MSRGFLVGALLLAACGGSDGQIPERHRPPPVGSSSGADSGGGVDAGESDIGGRSGAPHGDFTAEAGRGAGGAGSGGAGGETTSSGTGGASVGAVGGGGSANGGAGGGGGVQAGTAGSAAGGTLGNPTNVCPVPLSACADEPTCYVGTPWAKPPGYRCGYQNFVCGNKQGFVTETGSSYDCSVSSACGLDLLAECGPKSDSGGAGGAIGGMGGSATCATWTLDCTAAPGCETSALEHDTCGRCDRKCGLTQQCIAPNDLSLPPYCGTP
jgi:hypothetical protein